MGEKGAEEARITEKTFAAVTKGGDELPACVADELQTAMDRKDPLVDELGNLVRSHGQTGASKLQNPP